MKSFIPNFFLLWPGELFKRLLAMPHFKGLGAPFTVQAVKLICAIGAVALIFLDVLLLDDGIDGTSSFVNNSRRCGVVQFTRFRINCFKMTARPVDVEICGWLALRLVV
jgi:hypothetical protein